MARMSIDDRALRDPRILRLARLTGWSRRETIGALLDVWAVCYDRETPLLLPQDIDIAAEADGFSAKMVEVELARPARGNRLVHVCGVKDRIHYIAAKRDAGRVGGLKSAETRAKAPKHEVKQSSSTQGSGAQASGNPLPLASASASAKPKEKISQNSRLSRARWSDQSTTETEKNDKNSDTVQNATGSVLSDVAPSPASPQRETPESSASAKPVPVSEASAAGREVAGRRKLASAVWHRLNVLRSEVAQRFDLSAVRPLHPMAPGHGELVHRLRESLDAGRDPEADAEHVLAIARAEAMTRRDAKYLGAGMFERTSWYRKLELTEDDVSARSGPAPQRSAQSAADRFLAAAIEEEKRGVS
jgi:hypothetical protein